MYTNMIRASLVYYARLMSAWVNSYTHDPWGGVCLAHQAHRDLVHLALEAQRHGLEPWPLVNLAMAGKLPWDSRREIPGAVPMHYIAEYGRHPDSPNYVKVLASRRQAVGDLEFTLMLTGTQVRVLDREDQVACGEQFGQAWARIRRCNCQDMYSHEEG